MTKPQYIYVSGPYTAPTQELRDRNVHTADIVGRQLLAKGHWPFVPHKQTHCWEGDPRFEIADFLRMDFAWQLLCDSLYFISPSPGASAELTLAKALGQPVYHRMSEVPVVDAEDAVTLETAIPNWHELQQVWRRQSSLLLRKGRQYRQWWKPFGPVGLAVELYRKLGAVLSHFGVEPPQSGPGPEGLVEAAERYAESVGTGEGMHEGCRDLANYLYLWEAAVRQEREA